MLDLDARERQTLAPYAMRSILSAGRVYPEPPHPYRGPFQRDRDRLVHSSAFRRLSGKTQVFTRVNDHHRTRLTHTHEVASIARSIGRTLALHEDLIEALAYLHDLGHPPFGHAGEETLHEMLAPWGGFSHNRYALTLVEEIERRQPEFPGLNLSLEVLEAQRSRCGPGRDDPARAARLFEAQVVETADSIAYNAHDVDDALQLQLVGANDLESVSLVGESLQKIRAGRGQLSDDLLRKLLVRELIDRQVTDVVAHCRERISQPGFRVTTSPAMTKQKAELQKFLYAHVYRHPEVIEVRGIAQHQIETMFRGYVARPEWMPEKFRVRIDEHAKDRGVERAVGDFLASMTDRFCQEQFQERFA